MAVSSVRFGVGVTREVGMDLKEIGARLVLVLTDPTRRRAAAGADRAGVARAKRRPVRRCTIACGSSRRTNRFSTRSRSRAQASFDAFVAVGGGSTIDTAKAVNLYTTYPPADFLDYVNPPIGKGLPVPGPLKPLMAIPTTAGTGSETTGVAIFDLKRLHAKTGIANRRLKPTLGYLDPENTRTMPPEVAASTGLDILSHAVESYTAMPFTDRPRPERPALRPAYQGSNPDQRHLVDAGAADGGAVSRARGRRSVRRRGAGEHAAGGVVCRRGIRERGRASAARDVVSRFRGREELPRARVRHGSRAGPSRHVGHPQRAGGVPIHGRRQSDPSSAGGRGAGRGRVAGATPRTPARSWPTGSRGSCSG